MARIRIPVVLGQNALTPAAPSFQIVPGSFLPVVALKSDANGVFLGVPIGDAALAGASFLADVPDADVTAGALDPAKIKQRYPDHWLVTGHVIPGT